jgi:hypothetical protein
VKDHKDGFGLAAFLLLSGVLARLQARGVIPPEETRHLIDHAITTLENMPFQDAVVEGARRALEGPTALPDGTTDPKKRGPRP